MDNSRIERLLEILVFEIRKQNDLQDPVGANQLSRDSLNESTREDKKKSQEDRDAERANKTAMQFLNSTVNQSLSFGQTGDLRQLSSAAGVGIGGLVGMKMGNTIGGAGVGSSIADTANQVAQMVAPRGYNQFNLFEEFDKTRVGPYKALENYVGKMGYYGVRVPLEHQKKILEYQKRAQERAFGAVKQVRANFGDETRATGVISNMFSDGWQTLSYLWSGDSERKKLEKTVMAERKRNMAVNRQDVFHDNY